METIPPPFFISLRHFMKDSVKLNPSVKNSCYDYHLVITYTTMVEKKYLKDDESLVTLLNLNGEIFPMNNGYWTKFEACRANPDEHIPHGVRYSLTLHDRSNRRILGFDNAHAMKPLRKRYSARKVTWDHKHKTEKISSYEYESASRLLEDFWLEVEQMLGKR